MYIRSDRTIILCPFRDVVVLKSRIMLIKCDFGELGFREVCLCGFKGILMILAFLNHFIYKKKCFVGITRSEVGVSQRFVSFCELETMRYTIRTPGCRLL